MRNNRGYMNLQAVQVLNSVEYDINGNPIGLKEGQSEPSSCNFGIDRLPRRGGCYKGDVTVYLSVLGILATDAFTKYEGSGDITISNDRIDIASGIYAYGISIFRNGTLWAFYKMEENYGNILYDSSGNANHGTIVNGITVTPEVNPNSIHQYQNIKSWCNDEGYNLVSGTYIPKNDSVVSPSFKDVLGNNLQFFGKVPGRAKFAESNCFQQQISACYMTVTGLLATDTVTVFGSSAAPTLSANRMDFVVGSKYYGISIFRSAVLWAYYPLCESIINPSGHIYHDCSGNGNHATLINGAVGNESQQNEFHYLQKGFNKSGSVFLPKHLTNNTDYLGNALEFQQEGKSFLPSGCFLRQYQQPSLIQADKTSGVWFDANAEPYDVAYETLTLQDPINEQIFIGNSDKTKKLGPISTHKVGLTAVQKRTERVVRNVVDDALIEDPAFSHDVTVAAGDLTYSLYNAAGYTMNGIIDWGDGTTQSVNTTATQTITKTYGVAGTYTVKFTGVMESFFPQALTPSYINSDKVIKVNNWGNVGFKKIAFQGCRKLTTIPNSPITGFGSGTLSLVNLFATCPLLSGNIPDNLLMYATTITSLSQVFYGCTSLTGQIPENLFRYCPNLATVASAFQGCTGLTGQIPEELLRYNTKLTTVNDLFSGCANLSGNIPANLFKYNTLLVTVRGAFASCAGVAGNIPTILLTSNIELNNVSRLFYGCTGLTGQIPESLFYTNVKLSTLDSVFSGCSRLSGSLPISIFKYNTLVTSVAFCFAGCIRLTGAIPAMFTTNTLINTYVSTFNGCTGLTEIAVDLFRYSGASTLTFESTFYGCTGITSLPIGSFDYNTNVVTFVGTFRNTRITTIPSNLFTNNIKVTSFSYTFAANPSLAAIPSNLFDTNTLVTTFDSVLSGCTGITSIPTDLFRYNVAVTNMYAVFNNTRITAIPVDIFRYNTLVTTFAFTFASIGTTNALSIPIDIFRYNINAVNFDSCFKSTAISNLTSNIFEYNVNVTKFDSVFFGSELNDIPADLFINNVAVTTFAYSFAYYRGTTIPSTLFSTNTLVTQFNGLFYSSSLVSIPTDLFRYNVNVTAFGGTNGAFNSCYVLSFIPEDLFYYNTLVTNYSNCFYLTRNVPLPTRLFNTANLGKVTTWQNFLNVTSTAYSPTGTIQKIWGTTEGGDVTYTVQPTKTDAFNNCTALSNYAEIPVAYI